MNIKNIFSAFNISASGMSAQRQRMNVIAENMANAETTKTAEGGPYQRKVVRFEAGAEQQFSQRLAQERIRISQTNASHLPGTARRISRTRDIDPGVRATEGIANDDFKLVYEPGHPDADENGYVKLPNINVVTEMVDMMAASRAFEANTTAINAIKQMAKASLEI
jgi:flagellar basal-body rod protein FlgC